MPAKTAVAGVNEQITKEFAAAYLYLSMAAYFDAQNLRGFGHWMRLQHAEELQHALRLFDYLLDRGVAVELQAIPKPAHKFRGPLHAIEEALQHERAVTTAIHELYALASREKDYATQLQLEWFITEQVEEEKIFSELIARLKLAGDSAAALLMLDRELASRQPE